MPTAAKKGPGKPPEGMPDTLNDMRYVETTKGNNQEYDRIKNYRQMLLEDTARFHSIKLKYEEIWEQVQARQKKDIDEPDHGKDNSQCLELIVDLIAEHLKERGLDPQGKKAV